MSPKMNQLKKSAIEEMTTEMYISPPSPMKTICASKKKLKFFLVLPEFAFDGVGVMSENFEYMIFQKNVRGV